MTFVLEESKWSCFALDFRFPASCVVSARALVISLRDYNWQWRCGHTLPSCNLEWGMLTGELKCRKEEEIVSLWRGPLNFLREREHWKERGHEVKEAGDRDKENEWICSDVLELTQERVRTILPGWDFIGNDLYYYSCAKYIAHKYSLQIQGQPALMYFTVCLNASVFYEIKRGTDFAPGCVWVQQKSPRPRWRGRHRVVLLCYLS